jgi:hypothetical protein
VALKLLGSGVVGLLVACGLLAYFAPVSPLEWVGFGAVGVVVACWLTVSFAAPGRLRERSAWLGVTVLYVALGSLFLKLFSDALANDGWVAWAGRIAFGFLLAFFAAGLALAVHRLLRVFAGKTSGKVESATN